MPIKHTFVNPLADDPAFTGTRPSDWNANHDLSALVASDVTDFNTAVSAIAATASFTTISVSGQSDVVADSKADTLTIAAGSNVTITTDATTDTVTIAASGGSGSPGGSDTQIQFNNSGSFDGDAELAWLTASKVMQLQGTLASVAVTDGSYTGSRASLQFFNGQANAGATYTRSGQISGGHSGATDGSNTAGSLAFNMLPSEIDSGYITVASFSAVINGATLSAGGSIGSGQITYDGGYASFDGSDMQGDTIKLYTPDITDGSVTATGVRITFTPPVLASGVGTNGDLTFENLPVSDPSVANAVWLDNGVFVMSGHTAGGGAPAGSDGDIQFNTGGAFAADGALNYNTGTGVLTALGGLLIDNASSLDFNGAISLMGYGDNNITYLYSSSVYGQFMLAPNPGVLWNKFKLTPGNSTTVVADGGTATTAATISHPALATTSWQTRNQRYLSTTSAASSQTSGSRGNLQNIPISTTSGLGGARAEFIFTQTTNVTGHQFFVGLCTSTSALGGDPSALTNIIGVGYDAADANSGSFYLMNNDGSGTATKTSLGANFVRGTTEAYRLIIEVQPGSNNFDYFIVNMNTGNGASGTISSDRPASGTFLNWKAEIRTGATSSAAAIGIYSVTIDWPMA